MTERKSVAVILGSAFHLERLVRLSLEPQAVDTPWGAVTVYRASAGLPRPGYVVFRHGHPHRLLPHQVPYRGQAWALRSLGCGALLVTSSVGVLDRALPLFRLLLVSDLLMPENRLPDGTACTMFVEPAPEQGHLVLSEGLFSRALSDQVHALAHGLDAAPAARVVFAYAGGPRTKTAAENRLWAGLGAQVNSMTLGPEVVLANELGIPCCGLVVGHKYSLPGAADLKDPGAVEASLARSRRSMEEVVETFVRQAETVEFGNQLFRFGDNV